ncbi:MAG: precorrin-3B synthase [Rhizobiaceae bacterium]
MFRRGACPALSAPMQTGDGLLVRLATAGEGLSSRSVRALCDAARRHGNGLVEITARGNFQIRGLTERSAAALAQNIEAMELGLRDGVPVETNPLAGLDSSETANAAPLAAAIRQAIDATDLKPRLAPKVSVIVDGGGATTLADIAADIRLDAIAATDWLISIGGGRQSARPLRVVDEAAAAGAVMTILEAIATQGAHLRARDLTQESIASILSEQFSSSPPHPAALQPPSPRGGEEKGRHLSPVPSPLILSLSKDGERTRAKRPGEEATPLPLTDGRFAIRVALPFGSIEAGELNAFLDRASEITELRFAPGRAAALLCESEQVALRLRELADQAGLITSADDPRARIFACPGTQGCASGFIPARKIARDIARELPTEIASLHISGCAKGCAHPAKAAFTLVGTENGSELVRDGTARQTGEHFGNGDIARRLAGLMTAGRQVNAPVKPPRTFEQASAGD